MREAAGYIIFCDEGGTRRFLLLQNALHGTWSFAKGHLEKGEGRREGARRELAEETGISSITEIQGFEAQMRYRVAAGKRPEELSGYEKLVTLFLASVPTTQWTRSPEHQDGGFYTADDIRKRIRHRDLREVFESALRHLASSPGSH